MLRAVLAWLSGYAAVILFLATLINWATFLVHNGFGLILPPMRDSLGLSHFQEGSLISALSLCSIPSQVGGGVLASRYGARFVVGIACMGSGVFMVLVGVSPGYLFALVMSALVGFTIGGCLVPAMGLLSVWFDFRHRGTVAGVAAAGGGLSFVVIGAIVPWLTGLDADNGWRHTWYLLGGIHVVVGVGCLLYLRDSPDRAGALFEPRRAWPVAAFQNRMVWLLAVVAFCSGPCFSLYTTFFGVYLEEQGISLEVSGQLWGMMGILSIGTSVFWGNLSDRFGRSMAYRTSFLVYGTGLALFWAAPVLAGFIASAVIVGLTFRASYTLCAAAAGDYVAPHHSSAAFSLMGLGAGLGIAIAPSLGGSIADATGNLSWVFVIATVMSVAGVVIAGFLRRPSAVELSAASAR